MRKWQYWLILNFLFPAMVWAGEVTIQMPDAQLRSALKQVCTWYHCGYGTDAELAQRAATA